MIPTGTKTTSWQLGGLKNTLERVDVSLDGTQDNTIIKQRKHWIYTRYRDIGELSQIVDDDNAGITAASSEIKFAPGSGGSEVTVPDLQDDNQDNVLWTLIDDDLSPITNGVWFFRQTQTWEAYTPSASWDDITTS